MFVQPNMIALASVFFNLDMNPVSYHTHVGDAQSTRRVPHFVMRVRV